MKTRPSTITRLVIALLGLGLISPAQNLTTQKTTLVIFANRQTPPTLWPVLTSTLRREAAAASRTAPIHGEDINIVIGGNGIPGPSFPTRLEVELLGRCDDPWYADPPAKDGPLGWVIRDSEEISPVIYVDCAQINQLMRTSTRTMTRNRHLGTTSEAISHVILHEWIHIATQRPSHASHGIMQSELSPTELTTPVAEAKETSQCGCSSCGMVLWHTRLMLPDC